LVGEVCTAKSRADEILFAFHPLCFSANEKPFVTSLQHSLSDFFVIFGMVASDNPMDDAQ
jgi:hypothetical protein